MTILAPSTPNTAISPSLLDFPYSCRGFVADDGVYGGEVPSKT